MADGNEIHAEKELRIGLVLYGGVSLAIYIFGVVYELLRLVRREEPYATWLNEAGVEPIIDVVSGSSAGGINGLFLAKALATGSGLTNLQNMWLEDGAFVELLDKHSVDPSSLLDSEDYERKLKQALDNMDNGRESDVPINHLLDLFITATDLDGIVEVSDSGIPSKHYNTVFQFKVRPKPDDEDTRTDTEAAEEKQSGSGSKTPIKILRIGDRPESGFSDSRGNAYLAKVAASTSAFPVAFAPRTFTVDDKTRMRDIFKDESLFSDSDGRTSVYGDGGMVDNKPFGYTIGTIFRRQATAPVERKLVYVEPDPQVKVSDSGSDPQDTPQTPDKRDGIDSLVSYLNLATYESITSDLNRIRDQNKRIHEIRKTLERLEEEFSTYVNKKTASGEGITADEFRDWYETSAPYKAYTDLKQEELVKTLASHAKTVGLDLGDDPQALLLGKVGDAGQFLKMFDYPFRVRRLRYFIHRINWVFEEGNEHHDALCTFKTRLYEYIERYEDEVWNIWDDAGDKGPDELADYLVDRFRAMMSNTWREDIKAEVIQFPGTLDSFKDRLWSDYHFEGYEFLDMHIYPLLVFSGLGEVDPVEVIRFSPRDAERYMTSVDNKLAGEKLGHFSAFLKKSWRANDILWGRLDAVELIGRKLLEVGDDERFEADLKQACMDIIQSRPLLDAMDFDADAVRKALEDEGDRQYMTGTYKIGKESLKDIPKLDAVEAGSLGLRTLGRLLTRVNDKLPEKTPSRIKSGIQRFTRTIKGFFETLATVLTVFVGDKKSATTYIAMSSLVTLVLWGIDVVNIPYWPIYGAAAMFVGYWIFGRSWLFIASLTFAGVLAVKLYLADILRWLPWLGEFWARDDRNEIILSAVAILAGLYVSFRQWRKEKNDEKTVNQSSSNA